MAVDTSVYERQRRGVEDEYAAKKTANVYSRFLSQQRGTRDVADFTQGFKRSQQGFTAGFGQRGLAGGGVQSGTMQRAMKNRVGDYTTNLGRMYDDQSQGQRQFDLESGQLDAYRQNALFDIEANKQREIAQAALHLKALMPYLGGS
jgi:hypothetical protein